MKRFGIIFIGLIAFFAQCLAVDAVDAVDGAVSMVSYEQRWLDLDATIALKNNTKEDIHNVTFVLDYLDMDGKPLDYKTFTYAIDIAPGKTKKLDIPAYERDRSYEYYKTAIGSPSHPKFKVQYTLNAYNTNLGVLAGGLEMILSVLCIAGIFAAIVGLYVIVAGMAKKRNRDAALWVLLSFVFTPVLIMIVLLIAGPRKYVGMY